MSGYMRDILRHVFGEPRLHRMTDAEALAAYKANAERVVIEFQAEIERSPE